MKVILKPVSGTPKANLERARREMERVLAFRGTVDSAKALNKTIEMKINISPTWDLPKEQKIESLNQWITAKVRSVFNAVSVSAEHSD
jgi:hypothetical protein